MTAKQKKISLVGILAVIVISAISTALLLKYGRQILPVLDLKSKLSQQFARPTIPFSVTVGIDNAIRIRAESELSEEQKFTAVHGLQLLFHAYANNFAYYFPYFTIIEFGNEEKLSAFVLVFSQEIPRVSVENNSKKVHWRGQRINFDIIQRRLIYVMDGFFEFSGQEVLKVGVFHSGSLEPKPQVPKQERKLEPRGQRL